MPEIYVGMPHIYMYVKDTSTGKQL